MLFRSAYIPLQLECFDTELKDGFIYGKVICYHYIYYTKTKITSEYIETVAVLNPIDFDKILTIKTTDEVIKTNGAPSYFDLKNNIWKPVSKSHHGRFERMIRF